MTNAIGIPTFYYQGVDANYVPSAVALSPTVLKPVITSGTVPIDGFTITPSLPRGITLDSTTGVITITPQNLAAAPLTNYTLTIINAVASTTTNIVFSVSCSIGYYWDTLINPYGGPVDETEAETHTTYLGRRHTASLSSAIHSSH